MSYYQPDLTGTLPAYAVTNDLYTIFTTNQRIDFGRSIFLDTLAINIQGSTNVPFVQNTDWSVDNTIDIDYTEMSRMKNLDPTFSATLIKSILIISPTAVPYQISCAYQQLYPVPSKIAVSENGQVELTPDLILDILRRLTQAEMSTAIVQNTVATTNATPKLLPIDTEETLPGNVITGEIQTVNVPQGQNVIRPTCGSFYADSVSMTIAGSNTPLVAGTDYLVFGADLPKTKITSNTSGVYNWILILKQYVGNITLTYHAFGGDVTLYDFQTMYTELYNMNQYVSTMNFLTLSTLGNSSIFQSLVNRICNVESEMRVLINSGNPNYADVTGNGTTALQKIRSVDDNLHWWTIASLYTVSGSAEVVIADRMHFRMQTLQSNISADVFINVDLNNTANPFTIDTISVNQPLGYVPFTSYATDTPSMPLFRILYNTGDANSSGILLQIGLELPNLTETIALQDLSGSESAWVLASASATAVLPQDDTIVLPNNTQTWSSTYASSQQYVHMMPNKTGYLAWGGSSAVSGWTTTPNVFTALIDENFIVDDVEKIRLQFTATGDLTSVYTLDIPVMSYTDPTTIVGSASLANIPIDGSFITITVSLQITSNGTITLSVTPSVIPGTTGLTLRHIILLFE